MVGDVKQSIYRFRQARPELFMEKQETYTVEDNTSQKVILSQNFRSRGEVLDAVKRNKCVYLAAVGGAGALLAKSVKKCEVVAFEDLGCESVKELKIKDFPLLVAIDSKGNSLYK